MQHTTTKHTESTSTQQKHINQTNKTQDMLKSIKHTTIVESDVDQVFGQGFDQVLGEGKKHKYSVLRGQKNTMYYSDGKIYCTVLFQTKNQLFKPPP